MSVTADPTLAADPRLAELTEALDEHWLTLVSSGGAACSCGDWVFDARDPDLGEHLRPFSEHVASVVLALLPARTATTEAEALAALRQAAPSCQCPGRRRVTPEQRAGIEARDAELTEQGYWRDGPPVAPSAAWDRRMLLAALAEAEQREAALVEALSDALIVIKQEHGHDATGPAPWPSCLPVHIALNRATGALAASRAARGPRP